MLDSATLLSSRAANTSSALRSFQVPWGRRVSSWVGPLGGGEWVHDNENGSTDLRPQSLLNINRLPSCITLITGLDPTCPYLETIANTLLPFGIIPTLNISLPSPPWPPRLAGRHA